MARPTLKKKSTSAELVRNRRARDFGGGSDVEAVAEAADCDTVDSDRFDGVMRSGIRGLWYAGVLERTCTNRRDGSKTLVLS